MKKEASVLQNSAPSLFLFLSVLIITFAGCSSLKPQLSEHRELKVERLWVRDLVDKSYLKQNKVHRGTPLLIENKVIESNGIDGVVCLDKVTGDLIWKTSIQNGVESGIVTDGAAIYFGASDGSFYSLNLKTGEKIWSFSTKVENLGAPLISQGLVYFLSGNNALYALDAKTGKQIWLYSRVETSSFTIRGASEPVADGQNIYVGFSDGTLVAFNAQTGSVVWEKVLNKNKKFKDIDAKILIVKDEIFVSGYDDSLICLDKATAQVIWKVNHGGFYSATLFRDKIYYPTSNSQLLVIDPKGGKIEKKLDIKNGIATQAVPFGDYLVFGETSGQVKFLNAKTFTVESNYDSGRGVYSVPLIDEANRDIYFISNQGYFYKLRASLVHHQDVL